MDYPKVLCIIVTYNGLNWINKCMDSCVTSSFIDIMVIDNCSTDGTVEYIKNNYPNVKVILPNKNLGFGAANNIGFKFAIDNNYEYVYLLNQDAWISEDDISKLISIHKDNKEYGLLSPIQVNRKNDKVDRNFITAIPSSLIDDVLLSKNHTDIFENMRSTPAAHWLLPVSVIKKIGGFSPAFSHYGEDFDYTNRLHYWGYKSGIATTAIGVHDREDRVIPGKKLMHIVHMSFIYIYLNPNLKKNERLHSILKQIFIYVPKHPILGLKKILNFLFDLPRLKKLKKEAIKEGAFL